MKPRARGQARFDRAFDNYLKLTAVLGDDMTAMLATESKSPHWRRNFVRATAALLEGHAHGLRQMCLVGVSVGVGGLTSKELKALNNEGAISADDRVKYTLRAAYKVFDIQPAPTFSSVEWARAKRVLLKRHKLMHPTIARSLGVSNTTWRELKKGTIWLLKQFFGFLELLQAKYGS